MWIGTGHLSELPILECVRGHLIGPAIGEKNCENVRKLVYNPTMQRSTVNTEALRVWVGRIQDGDEEARELLLEHYSDRFERMAQRMLRTFPVVKRWEQTGDVLQNSMLRLLRALESVQPESERHFLSLASTQMRRELIDLARRYQGPQSPMAHHASKPQHKQSDGEPSGHVAPAEGADWTHEPNRLAEWGELHERIASLPDEEREVCDLLWYQELTQPQAADILGVSERTVKRRWQSARLKLHEILQGRLP